MNQNGGKRLRYAGSSKDCWVCGKTGCHSSNHPRTDRRERRKQFRSYLNDALVSSEEEDYTTANEDEDSDSDSSSEASAMSTILSTNVYLLQKGLSETVVSDFLGIALETCCAKYCKSSKQQYIAFCRYKGKTPKLYKKKESFNTSGWNVQSMGYAWICIPFGKLEPLLRVKTHIFDDPSTAPMLLSYDVMKTQGWDMVISACRLQSAKDNSRFVEYDELDGLPVYRWSQSMNSELCMSKFSSLYTVQELRNIHRRTGHPSGRRLMKILQSSPQNSDLPPETRATLIRISK